MHLDANKSKLVRPFMFSVPTTKPEFYALRNLVVELHLLARKWFFFKCREEEYFLLRLVPGSRDRVRDRKLLSTEHEAGVQCRCLCVFLLLAISTHVTSGILNQSFSDSFSFLLIGNIV